MIQFRFLFQTIGLSSGAPQRFERTFDTTFDEISKLHRCTVVLKPHTHCSIVHAEVILRRVYVKQFRIPLDSIIVQDGDEVTIGNAAVLESSNEPAIRVTGLTARTAESITPPKPKRPSLIELAPPGSQPMSISPGKPS